MGIRVWYQVGREDREIAQRETTEMGGHLGDDVENQCTGNSLEPVTVTLERTPSNGGYEA